MTVQISDSVTFKGQDYSLLACSDSEPFIPSAYGYRPVMASTACYRGYVSEYAVNDGALVLSGLRISHQDSDLPAAQFKHPPPLNGVEAEPAKTRIGGKWCFSNVGLPLEYCGGLVIAKGFIQSFYVHMGFHPAWQYEEVHELVFDQGKLISANDLSSQTAEIRNRLSSESESSSKSSRNELVTSVEECFSRDYRRKTDK